MRALLVSIALAVAFATTACGPSAAQVRTARLARYHADDATVVRAIAAAIEASRYQVAAVEPGGVRSAPRAFLADGTALKSRAFRGAGDGAYVYVVAMDVELVERPGARRVRVSPRITVNRPTLVPVALDADDRSVPPWIHGQVDALYVRIYDRLRPSAIAP